MSPTRLGAICVGIAAIPLIVIGANWLGANPPLQSDEAARARAAAGTVGGSRNVYLAELTEVYVSRHGAAVAHAVKSGKELAPILFLNEELSERGVKWRVRHTKGLDAQTYDIS